MDLEHLPKLEKIKTYVYVPIGRATRFVFIEIHTKRSANTAKGFLARFLEAFPYKVHTILTDNGSEFTDRFGAARWVKHPKPTGRHSFDRLCRQRRIEHRLTKPYKPQTKTRGRSPEICVQCGSQCRFHRAAHFL
jgi:transposase-like protein